MAVVSPAIPYPLAGRSFRRADKGPNHFVAQPRRPIATKGFASLEPAYMLARKCRFVFREKAVEMLFVRHRGMALL